MVLCKITGGSSRRFWEAGLTWPVKRQPKDKLTGYDPFIRIHKIIFGQFDGGLGFSNHEKLQDRLFWTSTKLWRQDDMAPYNAIGLVQENFKVRD